MGGAISPLILWLVQFRLVSNTGEGGETSEAYQCLQWRENCCAPCCANTNESESSSNLCTV